VTETSLKTGLALGKLAPMRTDSGLPFTETLTAPLRASVRAVSTGLLRDLVVLDVVPVEELVSADPVAVGAVTCGTKGSLLANVEKLASWAFERRGGRSELVSFGLTVDGVALAGVTPAVVAGVVAPGVVESTGAVALVVVAAGVADFFPPRK
jgi:hypothetical protein